MAFSITGPLIDVLGKRKIYRFPLTELVYVLLVVNVIYWQLISHDIGDITC